VIEDGNCRHPVGRDHHWSRNFLQDGGEEIYPNGTEGSNPACSTGESSELEDGALKPLTPVSDCRLSPRRIDPVIIADEMAQIELFI
jgi:hypothetical protein